MLREFRSLAILTDEEDLVLDGWSKGRSIPTISMDAHLSERTVNNIIARLRAVYDDVQPYTPLLPPRDK